MKRTRFLAAIMSVTMISSFALPTVYAENEKNMTPGIEMWANPSGTFRRIEGVSFDDLITSFGEGAFVYRYSNNKKAIVVTPEGMTYHFSNSNVWGLSYSVVTMREGTEPPVSEINEKIGAGDDLKVKFYKYADSNEYRFYISGEECADTVLDILKNDKDVLSIENRQEITEDEFRLEDLYVSTELTEDEFKKQYPSFALSSFEEFGGSLDDDKKEQGYTLGFKFNDYKHTPELYEELIKLDNSGVKYEITPLIAMNSGGYTVAEMAETIYKANGSDKSDVLIGDVDASGTIDVSDLTELSLALIGDNELTTKQLKAADIDSDGVITLADLARLRQYLSKKIESLDSVSSPAPTPMPTVTPTSTPTTIDRPQIPDDYIWPINRENHTFDYATLNGKAYTKRCVHTFDESTLDEKTRNAFFESTVERTGLMASVKTVSGISSEDMFLLKCGNEEGKYYVFLNESLTEEEAKKIYDQFGITEYTTPEPATFTEPEQPIPTSEPTVTPTSTPAYIEREPFPEGYIDPVNREDNPYNYATYKGNTYTKRCIHVFDETQFDEKTVNPFITKNRGGVMEFAKTVKGISSEIMFLVKCENEEGRYFVFLNENLTEEEAKKIYDQFGITEYSTPEPLNITEPTPESPIPTPVPTAVPTATDD